MTTTTTRAAALLLLLASRASASNRFNWTPSISLLDGIGEVNKNGFCIRVPGSYAEGRLHCDKMKGSSCLPDALETQFGYNQVDQTIYAVNFTCSEDLTLSSCLTVEAPLEEGSRVVLTDCGNETNPLQTFAYTSSGKFLVVEKHDGANNSTLCLGMGEDIEQHGSRSPLVDPTFWRDLVLLDCNVTETLITWLVDPRPIENVLEDGPFPGDDLVEDDWEWDEEFGYNNNSTNSTNVTGVINSDTITEETLSEGTEEPQGEIPIASVSKRSGGLRRILDEGM